MMKVEYPFDLKYPEHIREHPVRVDKKKYIHLDRFDAPGFIWNHINAKVVHGNTLNLDWCYGVYSDMLQYDSKDPTLTFIFEQHGILYIDTTDCCEYKTMKLRDYLAMCYELEHQTFTRKCRNITGREKSTNVVRQTNSPEYNHWYYITKTKQKRQMKKPDSNQQNKRTSDESNQFG